MCARAMLNCGVTELRIVAPRDGWPSESAIKSASGAIDVLENAKIFETTAAAVADLEYVTATTARHRDIVKTVVTAEKAATHIRSLHNTRGKAVCGILFGPERTGLENEDVAVADSILNIPLNPGFSSLNLAQAVLLVCYSWLSAANPFAAKVEEEIPASKGEVENLVRHFEEEMTANGFFRSAEQKPTILRNLGAFFFRAGATPQEISTFHGIIKCLAGRKK